MELTLLNKWIKDYVEIKKDKVSPTIYQLIKDNDISMLQKVPSYKKRNAPLNYYLCMDGKEGKYSFSFIQHCEPIFNHQYKNLSNQELFELLNLVMSFKENQNCIV